MKRLLLLVAFLVVTSIWATPAHAQLGILNLGGNQGITNQLDNQKNVVIKKQKQALGAPPITATARKNSKQAVRGNPAAADRYGRLDLVGHSISGYPAIRGELNGPNATSVSRGGANGQGARSRRR
jgi:hypothetical protein